MAVTATILTVSAALNGFSVFLIAYHTADSKCYNSCHNNTNYNCSHKKSSFQAFGKISILPWMSLRIRSESDSLYKDEPAGK